MEMCTKDITKSLDKISLSKPSKDKISKVFLIYKTGKFMELLEN